MSLYTLSKEMMEVVSLWYDEDTTQELLEWYTIAWADQLDDVVKAIKTIEANVLWYKAEEERLAKNRKSMENRAEWLKRLVDLYMKSSKQDKVETSIAKLSYRKSEQVVIVNELEIPAEYMRTKTTTEPDKTLIKEALKSNTHIWWAVIEEKFNLQIK